MNSELILFIVILCLLIVILLVVLLFNFILFFNVKIKKLCYDKLGKSS